MKQSRWGAVVAVVLAAPAMAGPLTTDAKLATSMQPVMLEPMIVTPDSALIDGLSQAIVAELLRDFHLQLPRLLKEPADDLS